MHDLFIMNNRRSLASRWKEGLGRGIPKTELSRWIPHLRDLSRKTRRKRRSGEGNVTWNFSPPCLCFLFICSNNGGGNARARSVIFCLKMSDPSWDRVLFVTLNYLSIRAQARSRIISPVGFVTRRVFFLTCCLVRGDISRGVKVGNARVSYDAHDRSDFHSTATLTAMEDEIDDCAVWPFQHEMVNSVMITLSDVFVGKKRSCPHLEEDLYERENNISPRESWNECWCVCVFFILCLYIRQNSNISVTLFALHYMIFLRGEMIILVRISIREIR